MFYDLNVPYTTNHAELQRTLFFLAELGYNTVALTNTINGKLPADLTSPIPHPLPFSTPPSLKILTRLLLHLHTPANNPRLSALLPHYDILSLRPTTPQTLALACQSSASVSIVSLDMTSTRLFILPRKTLAAAIKDGIRFEICYAQGVTDSDSSNSSNGGGLARRNLIQNATSLIRATQGRGMIASSEARSALACRGPWDVGNLAQGWGLSAERGRESVDREARGVVVRADAMRASWRGVVGVVHGGTKPVAAVASVVGKGGEGRSVGKKSQGQGQDREQVGKEVVVGPRKRKAGVLDGQGNEDGKENQDGKEDQPISKREMKRRAKKARMEAVGVTAEGQDGTAKQTTRSPQDGGATTTTTGGANTSPMPS